MQKKPLETIFYSAVGVLAMALVLIAFNVLIGTVKGRVDLTADKAYTLSPGTKAILRKLDTPVKVRFYCTQAETATPETVYLRDYARRVDDLLAEYKQHSRGKLIIERFDPQPDSDAEDSARLNGVEPQQLSIGERFYLGLAVNVADEKQSIPFLDPSRERLLEYDLSRAISRVVAPDKPVVGIMTPLPVFGAPANPMMMQMGQRGQEPWALVNELKNDFTVKRVEMNAEKIPDDVKVLFVIHPKNISGLAEYAIDQFVLRGGKLIAFLDPLPLVDSREPNPMLGNMPGQGSSLDKLLKAWGLQFDSTKVVADVNFMLQMRGRDGQPTDAPAFLALTSEGMDGNDVVTSQLESIWIPCGGAFTGTPAPGLKQTVMLKSTADSQLVEGFMAQYSGENVLKEFKRSGTSYALAVRLNGKFKTAFPEGKPQEKSADDQKPAEKADATKADDSLKETKEENVVILVGDVDLLYDQFALRQMQTPFGSYAMQMNGNLGFAQNAAEQLTGDSNLIAVRSRAAQSRPFTLIKKMQAQAAETYQGKIKELEDSLGETQQRLNELQQAKQGNQRFILSPEQQAEVEKFRKKEAEAKIQLKDERKKLRRDIDSLEGRLKWLNIAAMPVLVSLTGIGLAFYKRKRTSAK
jgi:ABC-type uncharacterized transport system involved in gliding motility auxiliary subunit